MYTQTDDYDDNNNNSNEMKSFSDESFFLIVCLVFTTSPFPLDVYSGNNCKW